MQTISAGGLLSQAVVITPSLGAALMLITLSSFQSTQAPKGITAKRQGSE